MVTKRLKVNSSLFWYKINRFENFQNDPDGYMECQSNENAYYGNGPQHWLNQLI